VFERSLAGLKMRFKIMEIDVHKKELVRIIYPRDNSVLADLRSYR
jgi:hypothetical protein